MQSEFLTCSELAKALKVSQSVVRLWTRQGLPCRRLAGKLVRFEFDTALAWLKHRQQESTRSDKHAA